MTNLLLGLTVLGVGAYLFYLARRIRGFLRRRTESTALALENIKALINLRPLFGRIPAEFGGWAAEADFGQLIASTILDSQPGLIVECGSGNSSVLIAACIKELCHGKLVSFDHEEQFASKTRRMLEARSLQSFAEVRHTPLVSREESDGRLWYDIDVATLSGSIDLLIVDGPPVTNDQLARLPAAAALRGRLSRRCVILLDDGDRDGEREIAARWSEELGASLQYVPTLRGAWILTREG